MSEWETETRVDGIAIIGLSGRFPGARTVSEFWRNLRDGVESITFFSDDELIADGVDPSLLRNPNYVKARGILHDIELFDATFFGFSPREAEILDPQQRLFLECAWEALENAGYNPDTYQGLIGVYAGSQSSSYVHNLYANPDILDLVGGFQLGISNEKDHLPTHAAYKLNLRGPAIAVQTACSTSLVAVCVACQSLSSYQCDIALAGGAAVTVPHKRGYLYQMGGITSPDGHCRAFDSAAQGTVGGNGVGVVVLKRLSDALASGDPIRAVIKGFALNNDGSLKVGYTAPGVEGQAQAIALAQAVAGVSPETITYVEAHGTGTNLGDPIEIAALTQAFRAGTDKKGFCAIGSVKTNVGHLDPASGVAGLIKTVLALEHGLLPPSLHFRQANPSIDFANSPFYVNAALAEWRAGSTPRRAGVSSFGIGGTNAHVVLEERPSVASSGPARSWQLVVLSAKTKSALESVTANLSGHLSENPDLNLADVAYTLQVGRKAFNHRRVSICCDLSEAVRSLETLDTKRVLTAAQEARNRPVLFMFPGQGAQYVNMALGLYEHELVFREQVDRCSQLLEPQLGFDLRRLLYPRPEEAEEAALKLEQTAITQPALFTIEYALARLWMEWGVQPEGMIGHSIGEYVAACLAGVFSLEDALTAVAIRGQLMQRLPSGSMLALALPESQVLPLLGKSLSLAAVNAPNLCVVSGPNGAVDKLEAELALTGVACRRLHTSHAFHSQMMEPILAEFTDRLRHTSLKPPEIPYFSNVTGTWITKAAATDPGYWARHLRQTVRFSDGLQQVLDEPDWVLLEAGPGQTLSSLAKQQRSAPGERIVLSSLRHPNDPQPDMALVMNTVGRLWLLGVPIDWEAFHAAERRHRIPLPTYPFERQRYWIDRPRPAKAAGRQEGSLRKESDIAHWFYVPAWKQVTLAPGGDPKRRGEELPGWLIFSDACGLASALADRLARLGHSVITVTAGDRLARHSENGYLIDPGKAEDYNELLQDLRALGKLPRRIVHLWGVSPIEPTPPSGERFEASQDLGFYSLLYLAKAVGEQQIPHRLQIDVVTNGLQRVTGDETVIPEKATMLSPCKVLPQEYPNVTCRSIDVEGSGPQVWSDDGVIDQLTRELMAEPSDRVVAHRGGKRWVQTYEPVRVGPQATELPLRKEGVYLITGGLGRIGLVLAEYLVRTVQARLVLTQRSALPDREAWQQWVSSHDERDSTSLRIRAVQALEALGGQVLVLSADVADQASMQGVVDQTIARFGALHGVIHGAGTTGSDTFRSIREIDRTACARQFRPKVHGLYVLAKVLQGHRLDFCLLLSSLSSVLGGLGYVAYSAANLFMDAFAVERSDSDTVPWISVNWDGWLPRKASPANASLGSSLAELAITPQEGAEAFRRILSLVPIPQVAVSTGDLHARIDQWIALKSVRVPSPVQALPPAGHDRPDLQTAYVAPAGEVEQKIATIWQALLGVQHVGRFDNFFELGGHSLLAIQLIARLHDAFGVELSVQTLFDAPTVGELATHVEVQKQSGHGEDNLRKVADILRIVENLSDDEIDQMLAGAEEAQEEEKGISAETFVGDRKEQARQFYDQVSRQLNSGVYGKHARFLNYGYVADDSEQHTRVELPNYALNRNSVKLVAEVIGDCDLRGRKVLDAGCGRGGTIDVIGEYFDAAEIVGLDLSAEAIAFCWATNRHPQARFQQGDAEHLPFDDRTFDVVVNIESSHSYPNLLTFYSEVYRTLKAGGFFLYSDLFQADQFPGLMSALADMGFVIEVNRDITNNVLLSCDDTAGRRLGAFGEENDPEVLSSFLAVPGSNVYNEMKDGTSTYRILRLRKYDRSLSGRVR